MRKLILLSVGDIVITQKPKLNSPFTKFWLPTMDKFLNSQGVITNIRRWDETWLITVQYSSGEILTYPKDCVIQFSNACLCPLEMLMARGCQCGAFKREMNK